MKHCALGKKKKLVSSISKSRQSTLNMSCLDFTVIIRSLILPARIPKKKLPETSVLGAKNATLNEAGEPFKAKSK